MTIYYTVSFTTPIGGSVENRTKTISVYEIEDNEPNFIAEIDCENIHEYSVKAIDDHFMDSGMDGYTLENCDYIQL